MNGFASIKHHWIDMIIKTFFYNNVSILNASIHGVNKKTAITKDECWIEKSFYLTTVSVKHTLNPFIQSRLINYVTKKMRLHRNGSFLLLLLIPIYLIFL